MVREEGKVGFDPTGFPADMWEAYRAMAVKCNNASCHDMRPVVEAISSGMAPISRTPFDKQAASGYGINIVRKTDSNIDKGEAKTLVELMDFLIDEADE